MTGTTRRPPANRLDPVSEGTRTDASSSHPAPAGRAAPPRLAPGVQLAGELRDSGFRDRQWLIQRDGQFLQVSELLYRVAEQIDGQRTPDEIAAAVTASTDWEATAENVRALLQLKLVPLGLVTTEPERAGAPPRQPPQPERSALMLAARMRVFGPRAVEPVAGVLQYLYAPALLVPALVVIAAAHAWLYLVHGTTGSLLSVVYTPGLLLPAAATLLVAGVVHELGHAAALRYGGGRVRGMGAGLYLIYPVFFTDVTDSYRLGRWARVRTDLGGFYFHLLFAAGLVGLYQATRQEVLLVTVLLINVDVVRQLVPFFRFDGYWALADLTGVPDFFSQVGGFLRSVVPVPGFAGGRLPALKPWARAVFATYIAVTIPVLALFFVLMLRALPQLLAFTWDSSQHLAGALADAQRRGDVVRAGASVGQIVLLFIPLAGTAFILYGFGWRPVRSLWHWSQPTRARRATAALVFFGAVTALAALWSPYLPAFGAAPPAGVVSYEVAERTHVEGPVVYARTPPVGGNHAPAWQDCGFYDRPVASENAVHSMEHGVVWITYRPDAPPDDLEGLRRLARSQSHVLVSPFPELPAPVVASAWGRQLALETAADPRLEQFVRAFRLGNQAPERGGPCTGGVSTPA